MQNNETALQAQKAGFLSLADIDFGNLLAEELDGLDVGFDKIKIQSAGSTVFEMPGENGEPDSVKEFSAVILYHHPLNCYYKSKYTGGKNPPDCGSFDGVVGVGDPGGRCGTCPLNQFGSGGKNKKACKNRRRIYVLREGEVFPLLLSLPTGSLTELTNYLMRIVSKGKRSNAFVTRFSLRKATSSEGVIFSQAQFAIDRRLSQEELVLIEKLTDQVKAYSLKVNIDCEPEDDSMSAGYIVDEETGEIIEPLGGYQPGDSAHV